MTETSPLRESVLLAASNHRFLLALSVGRHTNSFSGVVIVVFVPLGTKQYQQIVFFSAIINFKTHPNEANARPTTLTAGDLEQSS